MYNSSWWIYCYVLKMVKNSFFLSFKKKERKMKLPLTLTIRPTHALLNSNSRLSPHSIPADISHIVRAYPFDQNDETVKKKKKEKGWRDINSGRATIRKFTWSLPKLVDCVYVYNWCREREQQPSGDIEQQQQQPNSRWNHQPWPSWWWPTIFI